MLRENEKGKEDNKIETGQLLSQILLSANGKVLFGGSSEDQKPGSVHIYKLPLEKINEVQAHSKPIERMRLSFDNDFLFTAGQDGCIIVHSVKDRDPRGLKRGGEGRRLKPSEEILTEKQEIENYIQDREQKQQELSNMSNPENLDGVLSGKKQEDEIAKLDEEKANSQL
jgi:hypothetical protein